MRCGQFARAGLFSLICLLAISEIALARICVRHRPRKVLKGVEAFKTVSVTSVTQCVRQCFRSKPKCLAALYIRTKSATECQLFSDNSRNAKVSLTRNERRGYDLYELLPCGRKSSKWASWGSWSQCSKTCGEGKMSRKRKCRGPKSSCRGLSTQILMCDSGSCVEDSEELSFEELLLLREKDQAKKIVADLKISGGDRWGIWSPWGPCQKPCGPSVRKRYRFCLGGDNCVGSKVGTTPCNSGPCTGRRRNGGQPSGIVTETRKNELESGNQFRRVEWSDWSPCQTGENGCEQSRATKCDGKSCNQQTQEGRSCRTCPTSNDACSWTAWSHTSQCSASCGRSSAKSTRMCLCSLQQSQGSCPGPSSRQTPCNVPQRCPAFDQWQPWTGSCSGGCGPGQVSRTRSCPVPNRCGGAPVQSQPCSPRPSCPLPAEDCKWDQWAPWSDCSATCGSGIRSAERRCDCNGSGQGCQGPMRRTSECTRLPACVSCRWNQWGPWGTCSQTCGQGIRTATRDCSCQGGQGKCDGSNEKHEACLQQDCSAWTPWGEWGRCSVTCGVGIMTRKRFCDGSNCEGDPIETSICKPGPCPRRCRWNQWSPWKECSATCGAGVKSRSRNCNCPNNSVGRCFGGKEDFAACSSTACPVWGDWQAWSQCSVTCGVGLRDRTRRCSQEDMCEGSRIQTNMCREKSCPAGCNWADWAPWTDCSVTCSKGIISRVRSCNCRGFQLSSCPGANTTYAECCPGECPNWMSWGSWGPCTVSCGSGLKERTRECSHGGNVCGDHSKESSICTQQDCPKECNWNPWAPWGDCSVTCSSGLRKRERQCGCSRFRGECFGVTSGYDTCERGECPKWMTWGPWNPCTATCGKCVRQRKRSCSHRDERQCAGSNSESSLYEANPPCPEKCGWRTWSPWQQCSASCGRGVMERKRTCNCPNNDCSGSGSGFQECDEGRCPKWSSWQSWSPCPVTCGSGVVTRRRSCMFGTDCKGADTDTDICKREPCTKDCWGSWQPWGQCTATCGKSVKSRKRDCRCQDRASCTGPLTSYEECNRNRCPYWLTWQPWGPPSVTCGMGIRQRMRQCSVRGQCEGLDTESGVVNQADCKPACSWDPWLQWNQCSVTCERGIRSRSRRCNCFGAFGTCTGSNTTYSECAEGPCPSWGPWVSWSKPSVTCGSGLRQRSRVCSSAGQCAGSDQEVSVYQEIDCPPECQYGPWGSWGQCSVSCSTGLKSRNRVCQCPRGAFGECKASNITYMQCDQGRCPAWMSWGPWDQCSKTCGDGLRFRSRRCSIPNECEGLAEESGMCNQGECKADCSWGPWSDFGPCSVTCGEGIQSKFRRCTCFDSLTASCPGSNMTYSVCKEEPCPVWGSWQPWEACSATCGQGIRKRSRVCSNGDLCPGVSLETSICSDLQACDPGCRFEQWQPWKPCSATCGTGVKTRERPCSCPDQTACEGSSSSVASCVLSQCPTWNPWTSWRRCSATCGEAVKTRTRTCSIPNACVGSAEDSTVCKNLPKCEEACSWKPWGSWNACSVTCARGVKSRKRECDCSSAIGFSRCTGSDTTYMECDEMACPVWLTWQPWSPCSQSCGTGLRNRARECSIGNLCNGDDPNVDDSKEVGVCLTKECDPLCKWSPWKSWQSCSTTCSSGVRERNRQCMCSGTQESSCPGSNSTYSNCDAGPCPNWMSWQRWSPCSTTCGSGIKERFRTCSDGDLCLGDPSEKMTCKLSDCDEPCIWDPWTLWAACSQSCGPGVQSKKRKCSCNRFSGGTCEGASQTYQDCNQGSCPQWQDWQPWEACSVTCSSGIRKRSRVCSEPGQCPGSSIETGICENDECPTSCLWKPWNTWGICSVSCGRGVKTRDRPCDCSGSQNTECSGSKSSYIQCFENDCPTWNSWRQWNICSASCGEGVRTRSRTCSIPGLCEGSDNQSSMCSVRDCPPDCQWKPWGTWEQCSVSCGTGIQSRSRQCPCFSGRMCEGSNLNYQACTSAMNCPTWQPWEAWSPCSTTCGIGLRIRSRVCSSPGMCVGEDSETSICEQDDCEEDGCTFGPWGRWSPCSATCSSGIRSKTRTCSCDQPGVTCANSTHVACDAGACPFWTEWRRWTTCSATCGDGVRKRSRVCSQPGMCLGEKDETSICTASQECPSTCEWRTWGLWGACSSTCGDGVKSRKRDCPCGLNQCSGSSESYAECSEKPCPEWFDWSPWSRCSTTCGKGLATRERTCSDGFLCSGSSIETTVCQLSDCEDECLWGSWGQWAACSATCGNGLRTKKRKCDCLGGNCDGKDTAHEECTGVPCPTWMAWQPWTRCSTTCGPGVQERKRFCSVRGQCEGTDMESQMCKDGECEVPCDWSPWGSPTRCSVTCGTGLQSRIRSCPCSGGGQIGCQGLNVTYTSCSENACPIWQSWQPWSPCSVSCGTGLKKRSRVCSERGLCTGSAIETGICEVDSKCEEPCVLGTWNPWETCSSSCGEGVAKRTRSCQCPNFSQCDSLSSTYKSCFSTECPSWGAWQRWNQCSATCGTGIKKRSRSCSIPEACAGSSSQSTVCSEADCQADCEWRPWGSWGACSSTCGKGLKSRKRDCSCFSNSATDKCDGSNMNFMECDQGACPDWTSWRPWSPCSVTCDKGIKTRKRECSQSNMCMGMSLETGICDTNQPCSTVCSYDMWGSWGQCSATCGRGIKERKRRCQCEGGRQGQCTDSDTSYEECTASRCPQWQQWQPWQRCSVTCGAGLRKRSRRCSVPGMCSGSTEESSVCSQAPCQDDSCDWDQWASWGQCSVTCSRGLKSAIRRCPCGPGRCLGSKTKYMECGQECPSWMSWNQWSPCSKTCGEAMRTRNRQCSNPNERLCSGVNLETGICERLPDCPEQCEWSSWNQWSSCSVSCGTGLRTAKRGCPCGDGQCTGPSETYSECVSSRCPSWVKWGPWQQCSVTCGTGLRRRNRSCSQGTLCAGADFETGICDAGRSCLDMCIWSSWESWSPCSVTCSTGLKTAKRTCNCNARSMNQQCTGSDTTFATCTQEQCPTWSNWEPWGQCSMSCGKGIHQRSRRCSPPGRCSGDRMETGTCEERRCSAEQSCGWDSWGAWGECSVSCGKGLRSQERQCNCPNPGSCTGSGTNYEHCFGNDCPTWEAWKAWGQCSVTCGDGLRRRTRSCSMGNLCSGPSLETTICNSRRSCGSSCDWASWGSWGQCSASCGSDGVRTRQRRCPCSSGCPGSETDYGECAGNIPCPTWQGWEDWGQCSITCGFGIKRRNRRCVGSSCEGQGLETGLCESDMPCPERCAWTLWGSWSTCSETCGSGQRSKVRICSCDKGLQGQCAGANSTYEQCGKPCPRVPQGDGTRWESWQPCSVSCGSGFQVRRRICPDNEKCGDGKDEQRLCERPQCPDERNTCKWKEWSDWSKCSVTCGDGRMTRSRGCSCSVNQGKCEGPSRNYAWCEGSSVCGQWTHWVNWQPCSVSCGMGQMTRERTCSGPRCSGENLDILPCMGPVCSASNPLCRFNPSGNCAG